MYTLGNIKTESGSHHENGVSIQVLTCIFVSIALQSSAQLTVPVFNRNLSTITYVVGLNGTGISVFLYYRGIGMR